MQTLHEYQGFSVNIRELMKLFSALEQDSTNLLEDSGFNYSKVRGLKDYLTDFGLINSSKIFSPLGSVIKKNDKKLNEYFSKWICLYHWSDKKCNPILFYMINEINSEFTKEKFVDDFKFWAVKQNIKTEYDKNYVSGLTSKTINALTDPNAFQSLNLFVLDSDQIYRAEPYNVHPLLVAYILFDNQRKRTSISINELLQEPGNIGRFFGYDSKQLDKQLSNLQELGLISRVQTADLNMINYLYSETPLSLVERYYHENL